MDRAKPAHEAVAVTGLSQIPDGYDAGTDDGLYVLDFPAGGPYTEKPTNTE